MTQKQVDAGIDVVSDGEEGKPSYATYVKDRLTGFEGERRMPIRIQGEAADFPEYTERRMATTATILVRPDVQRADCLEGLRGGRARHRQLQGSGGQGKARRDVHDRRIAGRGRVLPGQRVLQERRRIPRCARRR